MRRLMNGLRDDSPLYPIQVNQALQKVPAKSPGDTQSGL
jgi:hypothetical protein